MNLELATKIAANPHVMRMVLRQQKLRARFVADYGQEFYVPNCTEEELGDENTQITKYPGERGVNRWTVPEEKTYNELCARLSNYRKSLADIYTQSV